MRWQGAVSTGRGTGNAQRASGRLTGVDDAATAVHVVESEEDLLRDLLDKVHGHALVLVSLDESEQVLAQDLEDHADVGAVRPLVSEVVEERNDVRFARMCLRGREGRVRVLEGRLGRGRGGCDESLEQLDLVECSLSVSWSGFDDLESDMSVESGAA